ncbi:MAG TPA: di-heme oxidoredictase family protein [Candidatus Dormibacteraeota bacterium]|nr:di-heme oxidoredictase family protein [Candidatus Dormibacteraeota bacterium]
MPLAGAEPAYVTDGRNTFQEVYSVTGRLDQAKGLGPRFNGTSCAGCHSQPVIGGSSPSRNPQIAMAKAHGARNRIPPFLKPDGPVRTVRFKLRSGNIRDGEVRRLFTITGRADAEGCVLAQPDFSDQSNMSFRIPIPTFGGGLVEKVPESAILANATANAGAKRRLGISGKANRDGDGELSRFGWKAQIASLFAFAVDAYSVELGFSDLVYSYGGESPPPPSCVAVRYTSEDDPTNYDQSYGEPPLNIVRVANFMRFLDQPKAVASFPGATEQSINNGRQLFKIVGCALCHTPSLRTGNSSSLAAFNNVELNLYSDLLVHHMGPQLADGIMQGTAGPDEFRTAPLWGIGQRIFFMHDGRTSNLLVAIQEHKSAEGNARSEANAVVDHFNALHLEEQQDIVNFLRSL